jgi:hypothetical protein
MQLQLKHHNSQLHYFSPQHHNNIPLKSNSYTYTNPTNSITTAATRIHIPIQSTASQQQLYIYQFNQQHHNSSYTYTNPINSITTAAIHILFKSTASQQPLYPYALTSVTGEKRFRFLAASPQQKYPSAPRILSQQKYHPLQQPKY